MTHNIERYRQKWRKTCFGRHQDSRVASTIGVFQDTRTMSATQLNSLSTRNARKAPPHINIIFCGLLCVPKCEKCDLMWDSSFWGGLRVSITCLNDLRALRAAVKPGRQLFTRNTKPLKMGFPRFCAFGIAVTIKERAGLRMGASRQVPVLSAARRAASVEPSELSNRCPQNEENGVFCIFFSEAPFLLPWSFGDVLG